MFNSLFESLNSNFDIVNEENSTGTVQGSEEYQKPIEEKECEDDAYMDKLEEMYSSIYGTISEVSYNDFKLDTSTSEKQKINGHIKAINVKLREVEQMINHASKLKTETNASQDIFWKSTMTNFGKINERLMRLSKKIREFNT